MIFSTNFENRVTGNTITQDQANKIKAVINKDKDESAKRGHTEKTKSITLINIKDFIKMARDKIKIKWRKKLKTAYELKKWNFNKLAVVLTRSALEELLFKKDKSKLVNATKAEQNVINPIIETSERDQDVIKIKAEEKE